MINQEYGYLENPANGLGIVRARTQIGNLRIWDIPRTEESLVKVIEEIGGSPVPGLYMLFDEKTEKKIYIGQSENLNTRILTHMKTPEDKIKGWDRVLLVNDGRCASQSDLNDENIRLILENYLVSLFKINRYKVVTSAIRTPSLSATQYTLVGAYKNELNILLTRKSKVTKLLTERGDDEVYNDEVKKILESKGYKINNWGKHEAIVNGKAAFIRPGSLKDKGWQVTFRGAKYNSFKSRLAAGDGYLIMPRGPILIIPLTDIRDFIQSIDSEAFVRDTIDIFIQFNDYKIIMFYKRNELDLTRFLLRHYE